MDRENQIAYLIVFFQFDVYAKRNEVEAYAAGQGQIWELIRRFVCEFACKWQRLCAAKNTFSQMLRTEDEGLASLSPNDHKRALEKRSHHVSSLT